MSKSDTTYQCVRCKKKKNLERHHVTYKPPLVRLLCNKCHLRITKINTAAALLFKTDKYRKAKFTNVVRLALWSAFLGGE